MELIFQKWTPTLLALQKRFNESKDIVEKFAVLVAITSEFEVNVEWLSKECERFKALAVDQITGGMK